MTANLTRFFGEGLDHDNKADKGSESWAPLRSRISGYDLVTDPIPIWNDELEVLSFKRLRIRGEAETRKKGKERKRFFRIVSEDDEGIWDCFELAEEQEAIDFMLGEFKFLNLLARDRMIWNGRYFWSIKDGRPYRKYMAWLEGRWL